MAGHRRELPLAMKKKKQQQRNVMHEKKEQRKVGIFFSFLYQQQESIADKESNRKNQLNALDFEEQKKT